MILTPRPSPLRHTIATLGFALLLSGCSTVSRLTPGMDTVKRIIPGGENPVDPLLSFDPAQPLAPGHTLRLSIHEALRSARKLWDGSVMVNDAGEIDLGKVGPVAVGGASLSAAVNRISAAFRVGGQTSSPVVVHVRSVEATELIALEGDIANSPRFMILYDQLTVRQAVQIAGGRRAESTARTLYIARPGSKTFFRSIEAADENWNLRAGDIIILSEDI